MEPEEKDFMRIKDIIKKASGNEDQEAEDLATKMADSIMKFDKAHRRGKAAKSLGYNKLAKIFFDRETILNESVGQSTFAKHGVTHETLADADNDTINLILKEASREELISWLMWNDPNGIYSDEASMAEYGVPMEKSEAVKLMRNQLSEATGREEIDDSGL